MLIILELNLFWRCLLESFERPQHVFCLNRHSHASNVNLFPSEHSLFLKILKYCNLINYIIVSCIHILLNIQLEVYVFIKSFMRLDFQHFFGTVEMKIFIKAIRRSTASPVWKNIMHYKETITGDSGNYEVNIKC